MHSDIEALEAVRRHYRTHYANAELQSLRNLTRRLRTELLLLQCEVGMLRILLREWLRTRQADS